jgi:hypothetical protein
MSENVSGFFKGLDACTDGASWAKSKKTLREVWETCERSDWMIWTLRRIGFKDDRKYRLYACACVRGTPLADGRTLWDLLADQRSRNAVEVAERYADGKASEEELQEARNAAYAADAAADAAYAAAAAAAAYAAYAADAAAAYAAAGGGRANARKWQANLLRQWISWDEVEAAITAYQAR